MSNGRRLVRSREIERKAQTVADALAGPYPPVDVLHIAREEGIVLAEDDFGNEFKGRIEYHSSVRKFLLFYPAAKSERHSRQIRFSIAHELGHFYLEEHRRLLMSGRSHSSLPGFVCDNKLEREADEFGAALLLPDSVLEPFRKQVSLDKVLSLSEKTDTSILASGIRAVRATEEAAVLVASRCGAIEFSVPSEEAEALGFKWVSSFPQYSMVRRVLDKGPFDEMQEGRGHSRRWFPNAFVERDGWEQSIVFENSGFALTLLTFDEDMS